MRRRCFFLLLLTVWHIAPQCAMAETTDERFVTGLVARRLFSLAELACQDRLTDSDLSPREQAAWTVELVRITALHAAHSLPPDRAVRWQAAHQTAQRFFANEPSHSRRILIELQNALTYLAEGEMARLEAEVAVEPQEALDRARDTIRSAARKLEAIDKQLTEQMATANVGSREADNLTADELFSLQNNVRYQLARAFRNQALCYLSNSPDRVAALSTAIEQLNATLTQLQATHPLTWQVYLDLATCYRLSGDLPQAQRALAAPLGKSAPVKTRLEAVAELASIMIAADRSQQALDEISRARTALKETSPALDFAQLQAMLSLWKAAAGRKDEVLASQWQKKVAETVASIDQTHGAYWGRRAKLGQLSVAGTGLASGNVDILASSADEMYHKKQFDEALRTYERAAALARVAGDLQNASEIEYKVARFIEQQLKRHDAASRRLRRLALEQPSHPHASSMHLLATWNLAQAASTDPTVIDRYQALLEEHLEHWPSADTANTARRWLGDLCASQRNWESATNAYRAIAPDSKLFAEASTQLATCWERWLQQRRKAGQPIDTILADATQFFDTIILGSERRWPERWSPAQLQAALATARLRLKFSQDQLVDAQRVLQAAMEHAPENDAPWLQEAQSLLIVALAGQSGQQQNALQRLQQLGSGSLDQLLQLIDGLSTVAETAAPAVREQIAQVQLAALDQVAKSSAKLDQHQTTQIDLARADALRTSGQLAEAIGLYRRLALQQPNNGAIQLKLADLLLLSDDVQTQSEAVEQWQKVARRVPPKSDDWLRARYNLALALYKRNRPAEQDRPSDHAVAAQRLRLLKATSNVEETPWKTKVDQLLLQCEQSKGVKR